MRLRLPRGNAKDSRNGLGYGLAAMLGLLLAGCAPFSQAPPAEGSGARPPFHTASDVPCGNVGAGSSYVVFGHRYYVLESATGYDERGIASWYGRNFHGRTTSSGQPYDMYANTAASKVLPLCTWVKVTNLENGKHVIVQINDRGPFVANRIIDLSYAAAQSIGMMRKGTALVNVRALAGPSSAPPRDIEKIGEETPTPKLGHGARIYLQLGAFVHHENAERLRAKLVLQQLGRVRIDTARVDGQLFYRVQFGPYATVDEIDALTRELDRLGYHETEVVIE